MLLESYYISPLSPPFRVMHGLPGSCLWGIQTAKVTYKGHLTFLGTYRSEKNKALAQNQ